MDDFEVKRANIRHHDVEAEFFERVHPEGSSLYERAKVSENLNYIAGNSVSFDVCIDVGCGTGFVTGFELPLYQMVVAVDISRKMLEIVKKRFGVFVSLNLVICDAEFLPFKSEVADFVSVSSVLHHLPKPARAIEEIARVLKKGGFIYITREPSFQRFRRFFDFFDYFIVRKILAFICRLYPTIRYIGLNSSLNKLDYAKVDVHYPSGFHVTQLSKSLSSCYLKVISAYSYHWIYRDSNRGWIQTLLTKSNFLIEKIPLSNRVGRYVSIIAVKESKDI